VSGPTRNQDGVSLTFDASSNAVLEAHLLRLYIADANHFKEARQEMGGYLLGQFQDNFDKQRLWDGSPMPQSKAAIARKGKTLIKSHRLYDSYVYQLLGESVEIGSDSVYARIHHYGGETGGMKHRVTLPARPVMGVTERQEQRLGDFLIAEIRILQ
jgi:phage virion morphogenesis protein